MTRDPAKFGGPERVEQAMEALEKYGPALPGFRRAHARGVGLRGHFTATPEVAALTTAPHLQGQRVEAVVRLSNGAPSPYAGDRKAVLGIAVRFALESGDVAALAALTIDHAPFGVPDDFIALQKAQRRGKSGKPSPLRLVPHILTHLNTLPGLLAVLKAPSSPSFAHSTFFGLTAYFLVDGAGERRAFRYRWLPVDDAVGLSAEQEREYPPQYLLSEIENRVAAAPVAWTLVFQMAAPGDVTDDVTKQWPPDREDVVAGTLVLDRLYEDPAELDGLVFDPTKVTPGLELSNDPLLRFRSEAYTESHRRRTSEPKPAVVSE
jgi:catalase